MQSTNGCCGVSHSEAGGRISALIERPAQAQKPTIEPESTYRPEPEPFGNTCDAGFLRAHPGEVLDVVQLGKTVAIQVDLAPTADPIAVFVPWAQYQEMITMRDRIAAITGAFQPSR